MYEFTMPSLGAEMTEGTLLEWKVKEGDKVEAHQIVAVVDTDKSAIEVEAFHGGVVEKLVARPGEKFAVGAILAYIDDGKREKKPPAKKKVKAVEKPQKEGRKKISPLARRLAKELGVDIEKVEGSGAGGSIVEADIRKSASQKNEGRTSRSASLRKATAAAMARSKREIPHYYLSHRVDCSAALAWLAGYNKGRPIKERLLFAPLLIQAVAAALKREGDFNGSYSGEEFHPSSSIHIGFAISLPEGGLMAPALLDVDKGGVAETMEKLADLVERARGGMVKAAEMTSATITITSLGEYGVDAVYGVIYPPQVALVGFGKIGSDKMATLTLAGDHRVSNGLTGSRFLRAIEKELQHPERLL